MFIQPTSMDQFMHGHYQFDPIPDQALVAAWVLDRGNGMGGHHDESLDSNQMLSSLPAAGIHLDRKGCTLAETILDDHRPLLLIASRIFRFTYADIELHVGAWPTLLPILFLFRRNFFFYRERHPGLKIVKFLNSVFEHQVPLECLYSRGWINDECLVLRDGIMPSDGIP